MNKNVFINKNNIIKLYCHRVIDENNKRIKKNALVFFTVKSTASHISSQGNQLSLT